MPLIVGLCAAPTLRTKARRARWKGWNGEVMGEAGSEWRGGGARERGRVGRERIGVRERQVMGRGEREEQVGKVEEVRKEGMGRM